MLKRGARSTRRSHRGSEGWNETSTVKLLQLLERHGQCDAFVEQQLVPRLVRHVFQRHRRRAAASLLPFSLPGVIDEDPARHRRSQGEKPFPIRDVDMAGNFCMNSKGPRRQTRGFQCTAEQASSVVGRMAILLRQGDM